MLHWLDIAVIIGYLILIGALGLYFSRENTSTEEYFLGDRKFSGWLIGVSLVGTSISSITFLSFPGDAFKTTWFRIITTWAMPLSVLVAAYVFLPFFRRGKIISAYEYLEERFGPSVRVYGSLTFIIAQLVRISLILYLLSLLIHEMTDLSLTASILLGGIFVAAYTVMGGIKAVIWTDFIQTIILVLGGLLTLGVIIHYLPGGFFQIISIATADGKLSLSETGLEPSSWEFSLTHKTGTMLFLVGLTSWLTEYSANQNIVQRYAAARNSSEARKAMAVCVVSSLPIWMFYMFIGTSLYAFFTIYPTKEAADILSGVRKAEQIFPYFILNYLPHGVAGLVISAALAAAMSSLDSSINAISTVGVVDIYQRHIVKNKSDRHYLITAWTIAICASTIMIFGALILSSSNTNTIRDTAIILISITSGGLLGLYILGFFTQKGNTKSIWIGLFFTFIFTGWTILASHELVPTYLQVPFDLYYTGLIGNILMFAIAIIASILLTDHKDMIKNLTVWGMDNIKND